MPNPDKIQVEAKILETVRTAARFRAKQQARELARVAEEVLVRAGKAAKPSPEFVAKMELEAAIKAGTITPEDAEKTRRALRRIAVAHPAERPEGAERKRIRFVMDREKYDVVRERIRMSGISMTATLEQGLEAYARTGEF